MRWERRVPFETRHPGGSALALHRHGGAYLAVVLEGGYFEAGRDGVFWCEPGCIAIHPVLHAHANRFLRSGARVFNLPCPPRALDDVRGCQVRRLSDIAPRVLARLSLPELLAALREAVVVAPVPVGALAQRAAALLDAHPHATVSITAAARQLGVTREHLARTFRRAYGLSPSTYRAECRLRRTLAALAGDPRPLSRVAQETGYADHPHLTRAIRAAAGIPPSALRRWLRH